MSWKSPQSILQHYFGYPDFRPGQLDIIQSILDKQDTVAFLPTGGGKSLCFQIPGLMLPGLTIVISPLISLMKDQVDTLNSKNIFSTYLNSSLSREELKSRLELMKLNKFQFVYVAPERLLVKSFLKVCQTLPVSLVVIDEAHCISQWGHDFRPSYLLINHFLDSLSMRPTVAAFTATATQQVKNDIIQQLHLSDPQLFENSFLRKNLAFQVLKCRSAIEQLLFLLKILNSHPGQSGIIYGSTVEQVESIARMLSHFQVRCRAYHGKLDKALRAQLQEDFVTDKIQLISATNAFGMGVDKPNVRFVIHFQIPGNLENYYQEAGRAGRDGQPADCYLLYKTADIAIQWQFLLKAHPQPQNHFHQLNKQKLQQMIRYAHTTHCRTQFILEYFDEQSVQKCHNCDNCHHTKLKIDPKLRLYRLLQLNKVIQKRYHQSRPPFTFIQLCFGDLLKPQTQSEYQMIPGIGRGWLKQWYNILSRYENLWGKENYEHTTTRS